MISYIKFDGIRFLVYLKGERRLGRAYLLQDCTFLLLLNSLLTAYPASSIAAEVGVPFCLTANTGFFKSADKGFSNS